MKDETMTDQGVQPAGVPDTERGLYRKYELFRVHDDGSRSEVLDEFFVLRIATDPHARAALWAYAGSCRHEYPQLAADLLNVLVKHEQIEAVQGVIVETLNAIGAAVIGSGFAPFASSPITHGEMAHALSAAEVEQLNAHVNVARRVVDSWRGSGQPDVQAFIRELDAALKPVMSNESS